MRTPFSGFGKRDLLVLGQYFGDVSALIAGCTWELIVRVANNSPGDFLGGIDEVESFIALDFLSACANPMPATKSKPRTG